MRAKRTIKRYVDLFRNPRKLFGVGPDDTGAEVILFPNGEREIWIKEAKGHGFRITASRGPRGLGLQISRFVCGAPMTINANGNDADKDDLKGFDATHIEICQYDSDPAAQAYKEWYAGRRAYPGDVAAGGPKETR